MLNLHFSAGVLFVCEYTSFQTGQWLQELWRRGRRDSWKENATGKISGSQSLRYTHSQAPPKLKIGRWGPVICILVSPLGDSAAYQSLNHWPTLYKRTWSNNWYWLKLCVLCRYHIHYLHCHPVLIMSGRVGTIFISVFRWRTGSTFIYFFKVTFSKWGWYI